MKKFSPELGMTFCFDFFLNFEFHQFALSWLSVKNGNSLLDLFEGNQLRFAVNAIFSILPFEIYRMKVKQEFDLIFSTRISNAFRNLGFLSKYYFWLYSWIASLFVFYYFYLKKRIFLNYQVIEIFLWKVSFVLDL